MKNLGEVKKYYSAYYKLDAMVVCGELPTFKNPFENATYSPDQTADKIILKGTKGEFWPVGPEKFIGEKAKYTLADGETRITDLSELSQGCTLDDENFTKISTPKSVAERKKSITYAAEFMEDNTDCHFYLITDRGDKLYPQKGDKICYWAPEFPDDLKDCWSVNKEIFGDIYEEDSNG